MNYKVVIDELVFERDFRKIDSSGQKRIMRAIREKLTTRLDEFGRPLHDGMRGFWKLRIGEFRVIYTIKKDQVLVYVMLVGFRRDEEVYRQALARLAKQVEEAT